MGASGEPPDRACVARHSSDKLLIQQNSISDGQIIPPVQESSQHSQCMSLFSYLIDTNDQVSLVPRVTPR
jgi:hypothetical protein